MSRVRKLRTELKEAIELFCPAATEHHVLGGPHICHDDPNAQHPHVKAYSTAGVQDSDLDDIFIQGIIIAQGSYTQKDGSEELWTIWTWRGEFYAQALHFDPIGIDQVMSTEMEILRGLIPASAPKEVKGYGTIHASEPLGGRLAKFLTEEAEKIMTIETLLTAKNSGQQHIRTWQVFEWACFRYMIRIDRVR